MATVKNIFVHLRQSSNVNMFFPYFLNIDNFDFTILPRSKSMGLFKFHSYSSNNSWRSTAVVASATAVDAGEID